MVTIFSKLHDAIKKAASAVGSVKRNTVSKKDFVDNLRMLLERYHALVECINILPDSDRQSLANKIYAKKSDSACKGCAAYINLAAECKSVEDTKIAFTTELRVLRMIENVLANFQANVDIIFEGSTDVNIHTAKLSHLACFGFIENAELYADYIFNMFCIITYEVVENNNTKELSKPLPYRYKELDDYYPRFLSFHRGMLQGGNKVYLDTFKGLKKSMDDIRVANPDTGSNIEMIDDGRLVAYSKGLFGGFSLNPFKWLGEMWVLMKNNHYVKLSSEKEDLIAHVNLLKMDLAQMDPNSKEYQKMVKVIDTYNQMIAKMDQKLKKYYDEENQ